MRVSSLPVPAITASDLHKWKSDLKNCIAGIPFLSFSQRLSISDLLSLQVKMVCSDCWPCKLNPNLNITQGVFLVCVTLMLIILQSEVSQVLCPRSYGESEALSIIKEFLKYFLLLLRLG